MNTVRFYGDKNFSLLSVYSLITHEIDDFVDHDLLNSLSRDEHPLVTAACCERLFHAEILRHFQVFPLHKVCITITEEQQCNPERNMDEPTGFDHQKVGDGGKN